MQMRHSGGLPTSNAWPTWLEAANCGRDGSDRESPEGSRPRTRQLQLSTGWSGYIEVTYERSDNAQLSIFSLAIIAATLTVGLPFRADAQSSGAAGPIVTLKELEHKTSKHPTKKYYVSIWPDGPQVSFQNKYGNFASYTFPSSEFPLNEPRALLSQGSPDLLPLRATRVGPNDYRIEWLETPPPPGSLAIVKSH